MRDIKNFIANLSHHPGVYQMLGVDGEILYVGKAKDLKKRIASYFSSRTQDQKTHTLVNQIEDINITVTHNENEAVLLECNLIKKHHPRYNVLLRDDKSYPYILITEQHDYPRIDIYRGPRKKQGLFFGPYPSAYAVRETIGLLQKIFRIRTCRDSYFAARTRPCLLYQIDRCTGPCVNLISSDEYNKNVNFAILFLQGKSNEIIKNLEERMIEAATVLHFEQAAFYRDQISRLRQIQDKQYVSVLHGDADVVGMTIQSGIVCIQLLSIRHGQVISSRSYFPSVPKYASSDEIISAFLTQHYLSHPSHIESIPKEIIVDSKILDGTLIENVLSEQSKHIVKVRRPTRGEKKKWADMATISAKQSLAANLAQKTNMEERALAFQELINLNKPLERIECFDISHSSGEATVASCVVFNNHGPIKSDYRRFNIADITPGDDVAAMQQVLYRRFKRIQKEEGKLPDVILIDGGITQLNAAEEALLSLNITEILLVGVAKGPLRKAGYETLYVNHSPPMHLSSDSKALHLIQQIRDEAHRFAITGHRNRRDKIRKQSSLEKISGIGAKRRRELLRYFGGIQGILRASLDELTKVPGISRSLAERIFAALHDTTL